MNCSEAREKINVLDEFALDKNEAELLQSHIDICSSCQSYYKEITDLNALIKTKAKLNAPHYLTDKIQASLNDNKKNKYIINTKPWLLPITTHIVALGSWRSSFHAVCQSIYFCKPYYA